MTKRMIIMLILVGLLFGGIFGFQAFKGKAMKKYMAAQGTPPQTVSTTVAEAHPWQPRFKAIGTLKAVRGADLAAEVNGIVAKINFVSGQEVKAGASLLELEAGADLARLQSLKASAELAQKTYQRDKQQFQERAISQAALDTDIAAVKVAEAQVVEQQAVIDKKIIKAPFAGRLGIRTADLGQYLGAGTTIVTLQSLDPIYVDFFLPQRSMGEVATGMAVAVTADSFAGKTFQGEIKAINPKVDSDTRNIQIRAAVPNPDHLLLPGMFVSAETAMGEPKQEITLPQTAISYNPYGNIVYLVKEGKDKDGNTRFVAEQKFVTTGATRGDEIAVLEGLKPGDLVVTTGQLKLHNGTPVQINNSITPASDPAPMPKDE